MSDRGKEAPETSMRPCPRCGADVVPALTGDPAKFAQLVREAIEAETYESASCKKVVDVDRLRARLPWLF